MSIEYEIALEQTQHRCLRLERQLSDARTEISRLARIVDRLCKGDSEWVTVREAAQIWDVAPNTMYRWCKEGKIKARDGRALGAKYAKWQIYLPEWGNVV